MRVIHAVPIMRNHNCCTSRKCLTLRRHIGGALKTSFVKSISTAEIVKYDDVIIKYGKYEQ